MFERVHTLPNRQRELSVAAFGMLFGKSEYTGSFTPEDVRDLAAKARGTDEGGAADSSNLWKKR